MKDFYYILGTDINCSSNELKEAYQKLSKKFHPDLNVDDHYFENRFREISEAYATLSDPVERSRYDAVLKSTGLYMPDKKPKKRTYLFKSKHIDIAFTMMLVLLTALFGYYVYRSLNGSKTKPVSANKWVITHLAKHHKRKHNLKATSNKTPPFTTQPSIKPVVVMKDTATHPVQPIQTRNTLVKHDVKPPVNIDNNTPLYTTAIKSNITGVVYMRKMDNYGSSVVQVIPTNSNVAVLEKGKTFYKILFNNKPGYVPMWTIETK